MKKITGLEIPEKDQTCQSQFRHHVHTITAVKLFMVSV